MDFFKYAIHYENERIWAPLWPSFNIYLAFYLFVSDKRQSDWTDPDQILCDINKIKLHHQMDDFMSELDEDVEGMQSTILLLQQQLRLIFYLLLDVNIFIKIMSEVSDYN